MFTKFVLGFAALALVGSSLMIDGKKAKKPLHLSYTMSYDPGYDMSDGKKAPRPKIPT